MTDETLPLTVTEAVTTKDNTVFIKVFARVRPVLPKELKDQAACKKVIETHNPGEKPHLRVPTSAFFGNSYKSYHFQNVFDEKVD